MLVLFLLFQSVYLFFVKLTVLAFATSIIRNASGESEHLCFVAECRGWHVIFAFKDMYAIEHFLLFLVC